MNFYLKNRIVFSISIVFLSFLIGTGIFLSGSKAHAYNYKGSIISVSPGDSLRSAIASASDGDIIAIEGDSSGVFKEIFTASTPIVINKSIRITSALTPVNLCVYASTSPSIGYGTASAIFQITAPDVTIENFSAFRVGGKTGEAVGTSANISSFIQIDSSASRFTLIDIDNVSAMATNAVNVTKKLLFINGAKDAQIQNSTFSYPSTASDATAVSAISASNLQISGSTFNISSINSFGINYDGGITFSNLSITNSNFKTDAKTGITSVFASNAGALSMTGSNVTMLYSTQTGLSLNNINNLNISACNFSSSASTAKHVVGTDIEHTNISDGSAFTISNTGRICDITKNTKGTSFIMSDAIVNMNFKNTFGFTLTNIGSTALLRNEINNPAGCATVKTVTVDESDSVKLEGNTAVINSNLVSAFEIFQTPFVSMTENKFVLNSAGSAGALIDAKTIASLSVSMNKNVITITGGTSSNTTYGVSVKAGSAVTSVLESSDTSINLSAVSKGIAATGLTFSSFTNDDSTFTTAANTSKGIEITGGTNAVFTGCDVTMDGTKSEGISVYGTDGITFTNCNVDIAGGVTSYPDKGIVIRANAGVIPKNLIIDGQKTAHVRVHSQAERGIGISIEAVDGATIKNIGFDNNYNNNGEARRNYAAYGMSLSDTSTNPAAPVIKDVLVTGCTFDVSGIRGMGLSSVGVVVGSPPENTYSVKNLTVRGNTFNVYGKDGKSDNTANSYRGDSDRCFGLYVTRQNNCIIKDNTVNVDGEFSKGISTGQGIKNQVLSNTMHGINAAWMGFISDGIGTDNPGESAYLDDEALFEGNVFSGSFACGMYISSNRNTIRNNDFNKAIFQNVAISIAVCRDTRILSNNFAPSISETQPVIRLTESWVGETSNNKFYFATPDAQYVLAIEGNAVQYINNSIDEYSVIENGNTIDNSTPVEIETARTADNSTQYSYVLRLPTKVNLHLTKKLADIEGNIIGTGKTFAVRLYDQDRNLIRRAMLTANIGEFVIDGLEADKTYYLAEENGAFIILGYEVMGMEVYSEKAIGFYVPKITAGEVVDIHVLIHNQATEEHLLEIPDHEVPLNMFTPPDFFGIPIIDISNSSPKTGDDSNSLIMILTAFVFAAMLLFIKRKKYSFTKQSKL